MSDRDANAMEKKAGIWLSSDINIDDPIKIDPALFPDWNAHPIFSHFGRRLYHQLDADSALYSARAFAVMHNDTPQLICFCSVGGNILSAFGLPIVLAPRSDLGKKRKKAVFAEAFRHLHLLGEQSGAKTAQILGSTNEKPLGSVDLACLTQSASPSSQINAVVDVSLGEANIRKNLRDSYRSLVNWGSRQLQMHYVNDANPDKTLFERYSTFHADIAGGTVRAQNYWSVFWEEIIAGRAELSLGFLADGSLVSGTIVTDAKTTSYYTSGVYDRSKFDKPLGHYPVFDAMVRAGERGQTSFDLGQVYSIDSDVSDKERQIGFFKKGFTSHFQIRFIWTVTF